jgi:hypothetical protein
MKFTRKSKQQAELDKEEPFTNRELRSFDQRERNFIRGIQIKERVNKKEAIGRYKDYLTGVIKNRKRYRNSVNKAIKNTYPSARIFRTPKGKRVKQVIREEKPKPTKKRKYTKQTQRRQKFYEIEGYSYKL